MQVETCVSGLRVSASHALVASVVQPAGASDCFVLMQSSCLFAMHLVRVLAVVRDALVLLCTGCVLCHVDAQVFGEQLRGRVASGNGRTTTDARVYVKMYVRAFRARPGD